MAGVLEQLIRPQKKAMYHDLKAMELEAAKEILAEVFRIKLSEVDEMIQNHYEKDPFEEGNSKGDRLWPQELWIEG